MLRGIGLDNLQIKGMDTRDAWINFRKTGLLPTCTRVLTLFNRDKSDMPYVPSGNDGYHPGEYSARMAGVIECSRPYYANKAVVQMLSIDRRGCCVNIVHMLHISDSFHCNLHHLNANLKVLILPSSFLVGREAHVQ